MKKLTIALLAQAFVATAHAGTNIEEVKSEQIRMYERVDMLESYRDGIAALVDKRDKLELEIKISEIEVCIAQMKRQILINSEAIETMEKDK